jgi:hypothetical protein
MKKSRVIYFLFVAIISSSLFSSCKRGCTDTKALNVDVLAVVDDGTCTYSRVAFYASAGFFNGIPVTKIDVNVNGNFIGAINTVYPNGPGNCSASGTVQYQFQNGRKVDWNTTVYLSNGATLVGSGEVSPSSVSDCIKVNVTR